MEIGSGHRIVVQTMCDTHTCETEQTAAQCIRLHRAGAELVRITVPGLQDIPAVQAIREKIRAAGEEIPLVADIHFSAATAIAIAPLVEKVRINPGNFHKDHAEACARFAALVKVCRAHGTAIRIGINHGSLGERLTSLYGDTPEGMCAAAMEWLALCAENDFRNVVVSLKASNPLVMVEAYRNLAAAMQRQGVVYPLHVGVTEAGNGDSARIKSCAGISALLSEGIGNTVRVSLTEDPAEELPVARYLADRYDGLLDTTMDSVRIEGRRAEAVYRSPSRERLLYDVSCDFGKKLMDKELDELVLSGSYQSADGEEIPIGPSGLGDFLCKELMQATRRRFYKPEYIACPGCGRTMYRLQDTLEAVKARTSHLKGTVIAVMGCIVNGPGEMADADWGYVGEGNHRVSIYHRREPVLRHVPEEEAVDKLVALIEAEQGGKE